MHLVPLHLQDDYWELLRPVSTAGLPRPKEREGARIVFASLRLDSTRPVGLESECSLGLEPKDTGRLFPTASHRSIVYVHSRSRPHFGDEKRTESSAQQAVTAIRMLYSDNVSSRTHPIQSLSVPILFYMRSSSDISHALQGVRHNGSSPVGAG